jgi:hypothetical protein
MTILDFKDRPVESFDLESFGGRLGLAMKLASATLQGVGDAVGISRGAVSGLTKMTAPRTSSRKVPEIAVHLGVATEWLAYGAGEPPKDANLAPVQRVPLPAIAPPARAQAQRPTLTGLQSATIEKLETLMAAGHFSDMDCVDLLTSLKPRLELVDNAAAAS